MKIGIFTILIFTNYLFQQNDGQTGGLVDVDLNVVLAWKNGYTGVGVNVVILDDGIQHTHPDLKDNYVSILSVGTVTQLFCYCD